MCSSYSAPFGENPESVTASIARFEKGVKRGRWENAGREAGEAQERRVAGDMATREECATNQAPLGPYGEDGEGRGKRATSPLSQCAHWDTSPYTGEVNRIPQSVALREIGN